MEICQGIDQIAQDDWNSLLIQSNDGVLHPALRHEFLLAMEYCGAVSAETGWGPLHLKLIDESGKVCAAMPVYIKSHSYGEYVFDWAWAQAFERHGLSYYPKLLSAIPFTPVKAPKLLARDEASACHLAVGFTQLAKNCGVDKSILGTTVSSAHVLFLSEQDQTCLRLKGTDPEMADSAALHVDLDSRYCVQFHLENRNPVTGRKFENFEDYLQSLNQKKRKNIKAERRKAMDSGVKIHRVVGDQATDDHIEFFFQCYVQTYHEHMSTPYLNLDFFRTICKNMGNQVLIIQANLGEQPVASSLLLFNEDRLYGRYWGAIEKIPFLHFELCYYQAIEFLIERGINWFEGGAQGEHKMARGLNPVNNISAHWVHDEGFKEPIRKFLEREKSHLQNYMGELEEHTAFKAAPLNPLQY
jgi:uncharacterized protein